MTDDISKVVPPEAVPVRDDALNFGVVQAKDWVIPTACGVRVVDERMAYGWNECRKATIDRLESATTPAEVDVPTIDRDEAFQRDYIPLGRSGWEIQTKGKGSTYRICDKDGDRLAIPDTPYLHETLTRMAREVHADYTTLARQLAEANSWRDAVINELAAAFIYTKEHDSNPRKAVQDAITWNCQVSLDPRVSSDAAALIEPYKSQLAEATRRLGEVEGLLREALRGWDDVIEDLELNGLHDDPHFNYRRQKEWIGAVEARAGAALTKEPAK